MADDHPETKLRRVDWSRDLGTVRRLFQEYRDWLADHPGATASERERSAVGLALIDAQIAALPGPYGPPRGEILLAHAADVVVACGALRELEPGVGEIKRVYVRADHRGPGFGPRLTRALLERASELGYERVRVDTLPTMAAAIEFYQELGFVPMPAYWPHPVPGARFFEYRLPTPATSPRRRRGPGSTRSGR